MVYLYHNKNRITLLLFVGIGLLVVLSGCGKGSPRDAAEKRTVKINGREIKAELAQTPETRYQGLSNRESMCDNCGMLFLFPKKKERTFVMRDMHFPLDILWIRDKKIATIEKNLPPNGQKYTSPPRIDKVLEVKGGFCDSNNIQAGDKIKIIE